MSSEFSGVTLRSSVSQDVELPRATGTVIRRDRGRYLIQVEDRVVTCSVSAMLRKRLIYPTRDPASLSHFEVQRVGDIKAVDPVAVGDNVAFVDAGDGTGQIKEVLPRRSRISRLAAGPIPLEQVLVANVDQMVVVFAAARPKPKWHLLDRYLVTAEAARVPAVICITKMDLVHMHQNAAHPDGPRSDGPRSDGHDLDTVMQVYRDLGYRVVLTSSEDGRGIDEVRELFKNQLSVLMGKSGVGKSSLLNALEPGLGLRVSAVGTGSVGKGRHTTTHLELVPLSGGGGVVDTPGMRELALWQARPEELPWLFPEFRPFLGTCKYGASCVHDSEPGCSITQAMDNGIVAEPRYRSYLKLLKEMSR